MDVVSRDGALWASVHQMVYEERARVFHYLAVVGTRERLARLLNAIRAGRGIRFWRWHGYRGTLVLKPAPAFRHGSARFSARLPGDHRYLVLMPRSMALPVLGEEGFVCVVPPGVSKAEVLVRQLYRRTPVPIHPSWAEPLYEELETRGAVRTLDGVGVTGFTVGNLEGVLMEVVQEGVRSGRFPTAGIAAGPGGR